MSNFFDLPDETITKPATSGFKVDPNFYNPDPTKFNGVYKSVFRFVPNLTDKSKTKYTKYSAKFWNPLTKESLYVDCPSNVAGNPSIIWTLDTVLRSLHKDEPETIKAIQKNFSRWATHISAIYIKKDPQVPELNGLIKLFKFQNQIDQLIDQQVNPEIIDGLPEPRKINPYHLLEGKDMLCIVSKKTKEFRDWTKCKFMDDVTPFTFTSGDTLIQAKDDPKVIKVLSEFIISNTPPLTEYLHQVWTEETYERVAEAIIALLPQRNILNAVLAKSKDAKINALIMSKISSSASVSNDPTSSEKVSFTATSTATKTAEPAVSPAEVSNEKDEYDDLLKDLM